MCFVNITGSRRVYRDRNRYLTNKTRLELILLYVILKVGEGMREVMEINSHTHTHTHSRNTLPSRPLTIEHRNMDMHSYIDNLSLGFILY